MPDLSPTLASQGDKPRDPELAYRMKLLNAAVEAFQQDPSEENRTQAREYLDAIFASLWYSLERGRGIHEQLTNAGRVFHELFPQGGRTQYGIPDPPGYKPWAEFRGCRFDGNMGTARWYINIDGVRHWIEARYNYEASGHPERFSVDVFREIDHKIGSNVSKTFRQVINGIIERHDAT